MKLDYDRLIKICYQCGTCSGGCPSAKVTGTFNPRKIIVNLLFDRKEKIIRDDVIWLCTACHTCSERCPELVYPSEVLFHLKNLATSKGYFPESLKEEAHQIYETGVTAAYSSAVERRRSKLGLPEFPSVNIVEIQKIMELTNFDKKMGFNGTSKNQKTDVEKI